MVKSVRFVTICGLRAASISTQKGSRHFPLSETSCDGSRAAKNNTICRYRSMGLATRQSQDAINSFKETKKLPQFQAEVMRTKLGMKNNVIRNLPKNVTY